MSIIPKIELDPDFITGFYQALGAGVGNVLVNAAKPVIRQQVVHADAYLNSFPLEKDSDPEGCGITTPLVKQVTQAA